MMIPFRKELDQAFRTDRSIWIKLGACAAVGALVGLRATLRGGDKDGASPTVVAIATLATAILGAILGLCLSLKDVVGQRIANGQSVNPLLRAYFGAGVLSLLLWVVTIFVGTVGVLMLSLALNGHKVF